MTLEAVKWLSPNDHRLGRLARSKAKPVTMAAPPPLRKRTAKESAEDIEMRLMGSMLADRDSFAVLVQTMRTLHGTKVSWMTDEQIAMMARDMYREKVRTSMTKAFIAKGRGKELVLNV